MRLRGGMILTLSVALLAFTACDNSPKTVDACGDGFVDPGEECDSGIGENSCASLGHYNPVGVLLCTSLCNFDTTDCGGRCGDEDVDAGDGEECDGSDLNGQSCQGLGHGGGTLSCGADCRFDRSGCTNACGNGFPEEGEACDDGNLRGGDGCSAACGLEEGWTCEGPGTSVCSPVCGDGLVLGDEECDGAELGGLTCEAEGYHGGELACLGDCRLDWSSCEAAGRCGDGEIQPEGGEVCDGAELAGETCQSQGFHSGVLACDDDCGAFDTAGCEGRCGDGTVQPEGGEACDQSDLQGASCVSLGWHGGLLGCRADCEFNLDGCEAVGRCGDGLLQPGYGELCDGANLNGQSCVSRGYHGGQLLCRPDCGGFVETDCQAVGRCGDGAIQGAFSEVCDGVNLAGQTCTGRGWYGGTLACASNCLAFDEAACALAGRCGDDGIQAAQGEVCDGANLAGQTCQSLGYYEGSLTCSADCRAVLTSGCSQRCGDGTIQGGYGEACDGANLDGKTCSHFGYYEGTLACAADCRGFVETGCSQRCGDGTAQPGYGETCDAADLLSQSCLSLGYYGGTLSCATDCHGFVLNSCAQVGRCGDNSIQSAYGEQCDGFNLNLRTCAWYGFYEGTLGCASDCRDFDVSGCSQRCGDGIIQAGYGELCDGTALGGQSCQTRGWYGGTLACHADCRGFGEADCMATGRCGDGAVQTLYGEQCDGGNLNAQTCQTLGWYTGSLSCTSGCLFSTAGCGGRCGDGVHQTSYELCDGADLGGRSCRGQGYFTGTLLCDAGCQAVDDSGCVDAVALDSWGTHSCAVLDDGTLRCWGANLYGELGDGTTLNRSRPVAVAGLTNVEAVAAGATFTCALLGDGTVRCWGYNANGELGNGATTNSLVPVPVPGLTNVTRLAAGYFHACAVKGDGTTWCWGANDRGQLGNGTTTGSLVPVQVSGLATADSVTAGVAFSCAVLTDTTIRCWGANEYGQLGNASTTDSSLPVTVTGEAGVTLVDAGYFHTCSRLASGHVHCWGANTWGQLGNGTTSHSSVPVELSFTNLLAVSAGSSHTCFLNAGGGASCWGANSLGQLGDNTQIQRLTPSPNWLSNGASISLGQSFSCALLTTGRVQCWGENDVFGKVGDGTGEVMRLVPTDVAN